MRLYLINPYNDAVSLLKNSTNSKKKYRLWKPYGLLVIAALTPSDWDITIIDEKQFIPDYDKMPKPDLVGITAFTSQADRAYQIARIFRNRNVPVVMGGIHVTMCKDEALRYADSVVLGEAESVWGQVLADIQNHELKSVYIGEHVTPDQIPVARHDLLPDSYYIGAVQFTRGCPLNCDFCSVTAFNGGRFRRRNVSDVISELKRIKEKYLLIVDDNLVGINKTHAQSTKELFKVMIKEKLKKRWASQVTINFSDDDELLKLAKRAGCINVFIGFESLSSDALVEINKKFNLNKIKDIKESVRKIHNRGITIVGSFIIGLNADTAGIGKRISEAARLYGIDAINVLFLTPLPGTKLYTKMNDAGCIIADNYPHDWSYYTLSFPVADYRNLSWQDMIDERDECYKDFYSYKNIVFRTIKNIFLRRNPLFTLVCNFTYRNNVLGRKFNPFPQLFSSVPANNVDCDETVLKVADNEEEKIIVEV